MNVRFTYCRNFAEAETREAPWDVFAKTLSKFEVFPTKEASVRRAAFVGGLRADEDKGRADGNIVARTVATIDFDDLFEGTTIGDIEFALRFNLECAFIAYSTFRHAPERPRFRLCVPLSRPVNAETYREIVQDIVDRLGLGQPDKCSFVMSQIMFLPSRQKGVEPFVARQDGEPWVVGEDKVGFSESNEVDPLEAAIANRPLDLSIGEVDALLENYPAEGKEYDEWLRVGMALFHQFEGSDEGWRRWLAWSELSSKHDPRQMRVKWGSFGGAGRPVTMASIIQLAGGLQRAVEIKPTGLAFAALMEEAGKVTSLADYTALRNRVRELNPRQLPDDMRAMIMGRVHDVYGKGAGLGKREIKAAFRQTKKTPMNKGRGQGDGEGEGEGTENYMDPPDWLRDWVYNRAALTFENTVIRESIKREAFRAAYDRMPDVAAAETDAATFALKYVAIPTVANTMFWPGQERVFEADGLMYLNSYFESGVTPCPSLEGDADAQGVVDLFLSHVDNTITEPSERRILIDWMAFVVQNPGKRVKWALLLQGIEGNGKSYFFNVMQIVLGQGARTVSSTALDSPFNGWAEGSILVGIEEIRIAGTNKYTILDRMKPLLTNDVVAVVHKGVDERQIPNFTSYMMFTNHADAIPVSDNDRRYCAIFTRHTQKQDLLDQHGGANGVAAYFNRLFEETERRPDALARFLLDWEISAEFKPNGRAPETAGLRRMRDLNVSEERDQLEEAIEEHACAIIGPDLIDITHLNNLVTMEGKELPRTRTLGHALSDKGYVQIEGRRLKINKSRRYHFLWYRPGKMSDEEAREAARVFHDGDLGVGRNVQNLGRNVQNLGRNDEDFSDVPF